MRFTKCLIVILMLSFSLIRAHKINAQAISEPKPVTPQQVDYAIMELQKWNMLKTITDLTEFDKKRTATRGELLVSCYEILIEVRKQNAEALERELNQLQETVAGLQAAVQTPTARQATVSASDAELVNKTLAEVEKNLSSMDSVKKLEDDVSTLRSAMTELTLKMKSPTSVDTAQIEKKVRANRIIASAAVVLSLALSITSAR